ncbi:small GTPase Rab1A [Reticulomyxa filosa]|uniref:Small GTPase Rab1A n=1 Tax=Reticulomyxa filosa TaxID=46433 RepID=X6P726_RETFI|nr:small GTPase Rab1A [Reticulomyxa filosa]|eukprot:ETO33432.1 small GTPase Rab1A [Reticulomyxa filosa]
MAEEKINDNGYDHLIRITLIGDNNVGKASILKRFARNEWDAKPVGTSVAELEIKTVKVFDKTIRLHMWSIQKSTSNILNSYLRGDAIGIVYDVTNRDSFKNLHIWFTEVERYARDDAIIVLIGNKCDLVEDRQVSLNEALPYAKLHNISHIETSAKTGAGMIDLFGLFLENSVKTLQQKQNKFKNTINVEVEKQNRELPSTHAKWSCI